MDESKAELVRSWLTKAKHDLGSAEQLANASEPYLDVAIYHCQQAAEKSLKAFLVYQDIEFEKIHNLASIINLCVEVDKYFETLADAAANLTPFATAYRYPDEFFETEQVANNSMKLLNRQNKFSNLFSSVCRNKFRCSILRDDHRQNQMDCDQIQPTRAHRTRSHRTLARDSFRFLPAFRARQF
ncbi:MAG: HEPN domain-containing protein [Chloroflexi bacterium]|nr:HEPN domain-containing protein [Chloroflexota bacterium]